MTRSKIHLIKIMLSAIFFISCYGAEKNKVKISGTLYNHDIVNRFDGKQIEFYNTTSGVNNNYLGSTVVKENGEFAFEYEISPLMNGPFLRIGIDTFFIASSKLEFLPLGESWNKNFNVSDSASVFIKLSNNLSQGDTIYLSTIYDSKNIYGPTFNKTAGTLRFLNTSRAIYFKTNKNRTEEIIKSGLTGDPIVDTITLDINP
jgi:hypothetical protein